MPFPLKATSQAAVRVRQKTEIGIKYFQQRDIMWSILSLGSVHLTHIVTRHRIDALTRNISTISNCQP
jgi:hypothetical protein